MSIGNKIINCTIFRAVMVFVVIALAGCDKEVTRSPVEPEPPEGFIHINSNPDKFSIYQNGRNTGRLTPDSISYIDAGVYDIILRKKYFKDTVLTVNLGENEKIFIDVDIAANQSMYGNLSLQTNPSGANIFMNDSSLNKVTPLALQNLLPGIYKIKFSLPNHRDLEINTIVESSTTNSYTEVLRDTSVWVDYQVFNSGIQSNSLTVIAVDQSNVKWFGSVDKGLIKFDESNFENFNTSNSQIPANKINCITIDAQNKVWVGTDLGIGVYDGTGWTTYDNTNSGLTSLVINTIRFDENGNCWIGTAGNFVKFDGINWIVYNEPYGRDWILDSYLENDNKIWVGTKMDGIYKLENGYFNIVYQYPFVYPSKTISSISDDGFGNIWFCFIPDTAGRGGVSFWNGINFNNYLLGTAQNYVNNVFIDEQNNKWFSTSEGIVKFNSQNISTVYNTFNSLISIDNTKASIVDLSGKVWITTFGGGLNKYKPPQ